MGKRRAVNPPRLDIREELDRADASEAGTQSEKRNFAQRFSAELATRFANELRSDFPGIRPTAMGQEQESRALTIAGYKKLDINFSTPELGLGLGVSIKTLNFRDLGSDRYTKNYTRIDNELRAEAMDYHRRQPYSVLIAIVFLPVDSCDDGNPARPKQSRSSFGQAVRILRRRAHRESPSHEPERFERIFIALYEPTGTKKGEVSFFDVMTAPPQFGRPDARSLKTLQQAVERIKAEFRSRNVTEFDWFVGDDLDVE